MKEPYYNNGGQTIFLGDCLEIMRVFKDKSFDLVLTDPPYNAKDIGPNKRKYIESQMQVPLPQYKKFCQNWIKEVLRIGKRVVFTPGIANICYYPQPDWVACWHKPAAVSFNRFGGFNAWEPVMLYGKIPKGKRLPQDYILENTLNFKKGPEAEHPCPKPLNLIMRLIDTFSLDDEIILDPFLGSGTTLVATKILGRKAIGIEISERYCKISVDRLKQNILDFT